MNAKHRTCKTRRVIASISLILLTLTVAPISFGQTSRSPGIIEQSFLAHAIDPLMAEIAGTASESQSPLEVNFYKELGKKFDDSETSKDEQFTRWLIGDVKLKKNEKIRPLTCVLVFSGTDSSLKELVVHTQPTEPNSKSVFSVLVMRMSLPATGVPSATISAIVEIEDASDRRIYAVLKKFEYTRKHWSMISSQWELKSR